MTLEGGGGIEQQKKCLSMRYAMWWALNTGEMTFTLSVNQGLLVFDGLMIVSASWDFCAQR